MLNGGRKERGAGKSCARWEMNGWEWDTSYPGNAVLFGMVAQTPKGVCDTCPEGLDMFLPVYWKLYTKKV